MTKLELAWHTAAQTYANTYAMGGTQEQKAWAWARANDALDKHCDTTPGPAARAKRDTAEIPAVPKAA